MSSKTIARIDLRGVVYQRIIKGDKIHKALDIGLQEAAHHGASVLDQTGDLSIALGSMGIDSTDDLESAIRESIGEQTLSPKMFLKTVLTVVGGGGVTSIPTASCLYQYLPHDRKPTREEMEDAWEKCCRQPTSANQ
jgi:hypothetical protein